MKQSGYIMRQNISIQKHMDVTQDIMKQFMVDTFFMAANEHLGLGYDRLMAFASQWAEVYSTCYPALTVNDEADYWREKIDQALGRISKGHPFIGFQERYPVLNKVTYEPRHKSVHRKKK